MNILNNITFEEFLASVYEKFPEETHMILGSADASPESGPAKSNDNSYSKNLIKDFVSEDTREFDRAALGLKAFFEIVSQKNLDQWTIDKSTIDKISATILSQVITSEDLYAWSYAILFNDLGKLHISNEKHKKIYGVYCADHDINMVNILKANPDFYPNFLKLPRRYQNGLIAGLSSGFNLGKAVQLESPNCAWHSFLKLSSFDQSFHLGHCLFDFIGVSGAANPRDYASFVMNNDTIEAFINTIDYCNNYVYGVYRLKKVGLSDFIDQAFPIARLVAMARIFSFDKRDKLLVALTSLPTETKNYLLSELDKPGTLNDPAIELQYSPAILTQVINNESQENIVKTLEAFAYLYKQVRSVIASGQDLYTLNLVNLASDMRSDLSRALESLNQGHIETMSGGGRWIMQ